MRVFTTEIPRINQHSRIIRSRQSMHVGEVIELEGMPNAVDLPYVVTARHPIENNTGAWRYTVTPISAQFAAS